MQLGPRIQAALAAGLTTPLPELQALLLEAGGERCHRRERITYLLTRFLHHTSSVPMASSTTHRFKAAFADTSAIIEDGSTRAVTARNLTDEDVPLLQRAGYAHLLEPLPQPEGGEQGEALDLHKLKKDELTDYYTKVVHSAPDSKLTKEELIAAIEAATKKV